ncbi:hypothetical protein, partial [Treponema endosymbiont of Eucomonympha sp.]|uniref:hypothetical protein n=1 Tax=Treponema endosymbiont of Eucomonympha sp. TaxID=1580831 RepID=UPI001EE6CCA9
TTARCERGGKVRRSPESRAVGGERRYSAEGYCSRRAFWRVFWVASCAETACKVRSAGNWAGRKKGAASAAPSHRFLDKPLGGQARGAYLSRFDLSTH